MPVKVPNGLPALTILKQEGVRVIPEELAFTQDIRPMEIAILNLMPLKDVTETQLLRVLSNSPLQVSVTFLRLSSHRSRNTSHEHLERFYQHFDSVRTSRFDALIVTGAPIETLPFEEVKYWDELRGIMDWSRTNTFSSFHICWGAQAALYHHYGVPKYLLDRKMSGVFSHTLANPCTALTYGFDERFMAPHSRHTTIRREDVLKAPSLRLLSESEEAGVYMVASQCVRQVFVTGHPEYDTDTLGQEYARDRKLALAPLIPTHYFPDNDPSRKPAMNWRAHAHLLFSNWLNDVYQRTPGDLQNLKPL